MTILLVLRPFAGLSISWLVITLAVHALPLYVGLAVSFWLHSHGHGYIVSILGGFLVGVLTLSFGRLIYDATRSPVLRLLVVLLFVLPAGVAGYQAVHGIVGSALGLTCCAALTLFLGALRNAATGYLLFAFFGAALGCAVAALAAFAFETVLSGRSVREQAQPDGDRQERRPEA